MITSVLILAILGFCISLYTYLIENKIKNNPNYKPACDLSDRISCSAPIKSEYANLFYFSNAIIGMLFYVLIAALAYLNAEQLLFIAAIFGGLSSCVLAYLLFFKIKAVCILCVSLYIINILILCIASGVLKI